MPERDPTEVERHEHSTWQSAADIYEHTVGLLSALSGQADLAVECAVIDKTSDVLDLGCGPGQLTHAISKMAGRVEGVDFAAKMISAAQRAYPDLSFQVANGEQLPFDDLTFDVVVCNYTAHHFARPEVVFNEVRRTLKAGGRLVIIHPIQAELASWGSFGNALNDVLPQHPIPTGPLIDVAEPREYEALLSRCGYTRVRCERRVKPQELSDIDQLLDVG